MKSLDIIIAGALIIFIFSVCYLIFGVNWNIVFSDDNCEYNTLPFTVEINGAAYSYHNDNPINVVVVYDDGYELKYTDSGDGSMHLNDKNKKKGAIIKTLHFFPIGTKSDEIKFCYL